MGTAKLMTPLFYDGNYNVEKKRMRAVLEREVSNGAVSYRLWRSDGKPDLEYPRAANDAYIVKAKLFCPEIAGLFCRIAGLFCHDSRANLSLKPVCFGIAIS